MAASVVSICNMALGNIGITQTIENLGDNNERARVCKLYYENVRDQVMRTMEPNFTQAFVTLAPVSGDPPPGWAYQYRYPTDCLIAKRITDENGARSIGSALFLDPRETGYALDPPPIPFEVRADPGASGRIIVTDQPDAVLWYCKRVTDPNDFDPEFVMALAWMLAASIAIPMKVNPNVAQFASNQARMMLGDAAAGSMTEQHAADTRQSPSITGRM